MHRLEKPLKIDNILKPAKIGLIVLLVALVTILHYSTMHGELGMHIPHRELYFIPILLASYWFGLSFGLVTSLTVSLIYAPHVFIHDALKNNILPIFLMANKNLPIQPFRPGNMMISVVRIQ